jgi:hypothetical protein
MTTTAPDTPAEKKPDTRPSRQRRTPAVAFLVGALLIGLAALAAYLLWGTRAEAPVTRAESVETDTLPPPDTGSVAARVEAALAATPAAGAQPARQAAAEAQAAAPELAPTPGGEATAAGAAPGPTAAPGAAAPASPASTDR